MGSSPMFPVSQPLTSTPSCVFPQFLQGSSSLETSTQFKFPTPSPRHGERPRLKAPPKYIEYLGTGPGLRATARAVQWTCWPARPNGEDGCDSKEYDGAITFPAERTEVWEYVCLRSGGADPQARSTIARRHPVPATTNQGPRPPRHAGSQV